MWETGYVTDAYGDHPVSFTDAEGYDTAPHYEWGEDTIYVDADDVCDYDWCDAGD